MLYFLLRYPEAIERPQELGTERLATLLDWHDAEAVGEYKRHRNQAILAVLNDLRPTR